MKIWQVILLGRVCGNPDVVRTAADAKRMGGGGSFGKQSSNVTQRQAPANNATNPSAAPGAGVGGGCRTEKPWGAMLVVWRQVASPRGWLRRGLGGAFGQIIMFALLALVVMVVIGFVMRKLKGGGANSTHLTGRAAAVRLSGCHV